MPTIGVARNLLWPIVMLFVACFGGCRASDPYALRGAWRPAPRTSLVALRERAALDGGEAIATLAGGDVIVVGRAGWPDRGSDFVMRLSATGARRWVRNFSACAVTRPMVASRGDDVFVAMTGLIDLARYRTDLNGDVCNVGDRANTATLLHFGPGGDVIGQLVLPGWYSEPPHLFDSATGIVAIGRVYDDAPSTTPNHPVRGVAIVEIDPTGRVASRRFVAGAFEDAVVATRGGFVVVTEPLDDQRSRTVQAFDATGATTWTTTLEGPRAREGSWATIVGHDDRVVVSLNGEARFGLDAGTGTQTWRSRADQSPRAARAAPLQPSELVMLRSDARAPDVARVDIVALDARSGATRTLRTIEARPRPLAHGFVQAGRVLPEAFVRAGDDLWLIGVFGGRLGIGDAAVEVEDVEVRRWKDVCKVECLVAHPEYVTVGSHGELFIARLSLVAAP